MSAPRCSKLHTAVDMLGQVLALNVTPAKANDRDAVAMLADAMHEAASDSVDIACFNTAKLVERAAKMAAEDGIAP